MSADESQMKQEETPERAAANPPFAPRYLQFGAFQIDLQREELWKDGERIRLQGKVYQTLLILLSNAGNVVTREEVRKHLWPEDLQVNFDANVNTTMNKLRQALGDSPEKPVYIETIPRRGYCFLATLEFPDSLKPASLKPREAHGQITPGIAHPERSSQQLQLRYSLPMGLRIATLVLAGMIVGSLLVLAWVSYSRSHKVLNSNLGIACEQAAEMDCMRR